VGEINAIRGRTGGNALSRIVSVTVERGHLSQKLDGPLGSASTGKEIKLCGVLES
jgi:hypothetical protein